ncbi:MAG: alpha/beta hydrolase [Bacteroidota bacterium]
MFGNLVANLMINPGKSPVFNNPKDFGLEYEDVEFKAADGVTLRGWLIRGKGKHVIVQSHFGVQCSRAGYCPKAQGMIKMWDKDIEFLNQAKYFVDAGYSVLMYDLRNHGESDSGTIPYVTWGPEEAKDVTAAVDFIANHSDFKDSEIGMFSVCMGNSSTTFAYGDKSLQKYDQIKALISIQPLDYARFVKAFGIPKFMARSGNKRIQQRTGIDFNTNTFMPHVKDITVPTLVIQNSNDPWTDKNLVEQYYKDLQVEKKMLWLDLKKKRAAAYDWIGHNSEEILGWFGKYMSPTLD